MSDVVEDEGGAADTISRSREREKEGRQSERVWEESRRRL